VLATISGLASTALFTAILSSPKARSSVFNIYLAALNWPDITFSVAFLFTSLQNLGHGGYLIGMCKYQSFFVAFGGSASFYMNALIAYEVYGLLSATKRLKAYIPPSNRTVILRVLAVYAWCAFLASCVLWAVPIYPYLMRGLICLPSEVSTASSMFRFAVFMPMTFMAPVMFSVGIGFVSWLQGLIRFYPPMKALSSGAEQGSMSVAIGNRRRQARALFLYFTRIFVALLLWIPLVGSTMLDVRSIWPLASGMTLGFAQPIFTVAAALSKADVREALLIDLLRCGRWSATHQVRPRIVLPTGEPAVDLASVR
jgi:hypothetical protein